jgi:glycosyltransferase involved in cell wall biosynthesis
MSNIATRQDRVDILLSTFNGERFIERQIESVLQQMDSACRLLIRDDGSTDATMAVVRPFVAQQPRRVVLLDDRSPGLGSCSSFGRLLEQADADYVLFCDQDDVWLPGRIAKTIGRIKEIEREHGTDTPVLAHTDLVVADEDLRAIAPSFWLYSNLRPERGNTLNRLLVQNVVTGCATTINRALARLAAPIPRATVPMHDWWLALVASAFGRIVAIPEATVLYRQHASNCLGATRYNWRYVMRRGAEIACAGGMTQRLDVSTEQARTFLECFIGRLDPKSRAMLQDFLALKNVSYFRRRRLLLQHQFLGSGRLRNLAWLAMI